MNAVEAVVVVAPPERDSALNRALAIWANWMTLKDRQEPAGWSHPQDAKDFMRTGEAVDVMVNDLPRVQWWAIYKARGLATVWRFPDRSFPDALADAETALENKMRFNLVTRKFFD